MSNSDIKIKDVSRKSGQLLTLDLSELPKLPYPYEDWEEPSIEELSEAKREKYETNLDGVMNVQVPVPVKEEKAELISAATSAC